MITWRGWELLRARLWRRAKRGRGLEGLLWRGWLAERLRGLKGRASWGRLLEGRRGRWLWEGCRWLLWRVKGWLRRRVKHRLRDGLIEGLLLRCRGRCLFWHLAFRAG